jgi:hypothetical protein
MTVEQPRGDDGKFTPTDGDDADADADTTTPDAPAPDPDRDRTYTYDDIHKVRDEAKRYRMRLRETEEARTALQTRVDVHDRAAIERIAGEKLNDPSDVFLVHDIADFRGEDGALDEDLARGHVEKLASEHEHWAKPAVSFDGGVRRPVSQEASFGQILKRQATGRDE